MFKLTSLMSVVGTLYLTVANLVANTASWVVFHSEEVPNELKK